FGEHRQDWQPVGLGSRLQRIKLFQFLRGKLLERRGDGAFLNINLLAGQFFELLHGLRKRLESDRLTGREKGSPKLWVVGERRAGRGVLVVVVTVALVSNLDLARPK